MLRLEFKIKAIFPKVVISTKDEPKPEFQKQEPKTNRRGEIFKTKEKQKQKQFQKNKATKKSNYSTHIQSL
jgi:hypothetical protein